jgi:RNA polymerase sigma-70 factor (ECF subfamily)
MSGDDDVTVERAKRGDREAFAALVRKHQRRVYSTAFHITGHHGDADDVAQEAFLRAFRALPRFDGRSEFFTWLYRIVVNVALNALRSRKRATFEPLDRGERRAAGGVDPARQTEARAEARRVLEALAELPLALRVTLVLAAVEQLPYREIAVAMDCPEGTVAWRVNQARKQLRHKLADLTSAEEIEPDELLRRAKHAAAAP